MNESTALAIRPVTPNTWQMIEAIAPSMHACRFYGVASTAQAAAIMLKGHELGLGLGAAFEFIQVVQSKPTLIPRGALAMVLSSGQLAGMKLDEKNDAKGNPYSCTCSMSRKGGFEYSATFTMDDAKRAGLVKDGSGWQSYPQNMLKWRAIGFCIDILFSDVTGGMKRADEFGADVDSAGNVIEGNWKDVSPVSVASTETAAPAVVVEPAQPTGPTLDDLVAKFGPEAVMQAAGNRIPATSEEVAAVAAALGREGNE